MVDQTVKNDNKSADARAYAWEASIAPVRELDWKTLMSLSAGGGDPSLMIATAFRELAENAGKIGELNMSPDLLRSLTRKPASATRRPVTEKHERRPGDDR